MRLAWLVLVDIIRSNFAVARIVLSPDRRDRHSGFVSIPLDLRDSYALAVLACIITSTPGTIWVDFNSSNRVLLIHVLDLIDEDAWVRTIKNRYAAGDFRMSAQTLLIWSITVAQILLVLAAACAVFRLLQGPRAQDRVLGLDTLYVNSMLLLVVFGTSSGSTLYFEAALVIALLGFVGTVALAKFLLRGEVIE
jgi:multicomponent K+:H+ antiporter subunit F